MCRLRQPVPQRVCGDFGASMGTGLCVDVGDVPRYGSLAQDEAFSDLAVALPGDEERENLEFSGR